MPNSDEFETILTTYINDMYALALQLTRSEDSAQDLVQDLFVSLSLKRYNSREIKRPKAWLAAILYRIFVDQWRRKVNSPVQFGLNSGTEDGADVTISATCSRPGPLQNLELSYEQQRAQTALEELNERQHQVLVMHDVEGYTMAEIGQIMEIPLGTVKSNLHRARDRLNSILNPPGDSLVTTPNAAAQTE